MEQNNCGCGRSNHYPKKKECGCKGPKHDSCKNPCEDSCSKNIQVTSENVIWTNGPVFELGIKTGDNLEVVVEKIAKAIDSLKDIL